MSKTKIGSNAQFTGSGKGIQYIGNHVYGYSGEVLCNDNLTTLLDLTTSKDYILAKFQFGVKHDTNANLSFQIKFNGIMVAGYMITGGVTDAQMSNYIPLIIPPLTHVETLGQNTYDSTNIPITSVLVGETIKNG
jgi:hypothetical protein